MIIAEINGKIPRQYEGMEDVLTSNVFSFFKYSDRALLKEYLQLFGIYISTVESENAEFIFWPTYDDGTEPDLVIICGKYYLLIEAKFNSDFSLKTATSDSQMEREIKMGKISANNINKEFVYLVITAEYYKNPIKYSWIEKSSTTFIWTNWHAISNFLNDKISNRLLKKDIEYAIDLYSFLVRKKLRTFIGLINLLPSQHISNPKSIFYNIESSKYRGEFLGFKYRLNDFIKVGNYQKFYNKTYFNKLTILTIYSNEKFIFYHGKKF